MGILANFDKLNRLTKKSVQEKDEENKQSSIILYIVNSTKML